MDSLDTLLQPVLHSPQLVEAVDRLQQQIESERELRQQFYDEMTPEQKVEFINGEVVLHSPARNRHLDASSELLMLLKAHVKRHGLGTVKTEKCLCVFPRNDYEPDIVYFGAEKTALLEPETMRFPIPDFVVEVLSESTEQRDRGVKFDDFAAHGVEEYWIIDTESECVEQYIPGKGGVYDLVLKSGQGTIQSRVIEGFVVEIRAIFDEEINLRELHRILED